MNPLAGAANTAPYRNHPDHSAALLVKDSVTPYHAYPARIDEAIRHVYSELGMFIDNMPKPGNLPEWWAFIPRARSDWKQPLQDRLDQLAEADTKDIPRICDPITAAAHVHGLTRHTGLSVAAARIATFCDPGEATPETIRSLFETHRHAPAAALVGLLHDDYSGAIASPAGHAFDNRRMNLLRLFATPSKENA